MGVSTQLIHKPPRSPLGFFHTCESGRHLFNIELYSVIVSGSHSKKLCRSQTQTEADIRE
mgnify:FL=1